MTQTIAQALAETAIFQHGAVQKAPELTAFAEFLLKRPRPRYVLEIGSQDGGMLWFFGQFATSGVMSIDQKVRLPSGHVPVALFLVEGDSHLPVTKSQLPPQSVMAIDWLFIDGDHTYEGAKCDYEMYGPLVASGGLICFHDIVPHSMEVDSGASRLWSEIQNPLKWETAWTNAANIKDGVVLPGPSCGIGAIQVP